MQRVVFRTILWALPLMLRRAAATPVNIAGERVDIGGCLNTLTPSRSQMRGTSSMAPNSCLVDVVAWPHRWNVVARVV